MRVAASDAATSCQVPGCGRAAVFGDDWGPDPRRQGLTDFRLGLELRLRVRDLGVVLALCEAHADELLTLAWTPVLDRLDSWGWRPLA